jgi:DNA polymerase elongation subunit (family B)
MLDATLTIYAYKRNQVFPKKENKNERESYEGAFVFNPIPGLYEWVASYDYSSLYPSIIRQFNLSIENFKFKDKSYQPGPNEVKTSSGAVFDSSYQGLIPEILTDYFMKRKEAKRIGMQAEKEADELKRILSKRRNESKLKMS